MQDLHLWLDVHVPERLVQPVSVEKLPDFWYSNTQRSCEAEMILSVNNLLGGFRRCSAAVFLATSDAQSPARSAANSPQCLRGVVHWSNWSCHASLTSSTTHSGQYSFSRVWMAESEDAECPSLLARTCPCHAHVPSRVSPDVGGSSIMRWSTCGSSSERAPEVGVPAWRTFQWSAYELERLGGCCRGWYKSPNVLATTR